MRKLKTISSINTFIKNDQEDRDLPEKYIKPLKSVCEKLGMIDDIYVFETSHGFTVDGKVKMSPGEKSIQLSPRDLIALYSLKGLRYVRINPPEISIGLE